MSKKDLNFRIPPTIAVADGATTPDPGGTAAKGVAAWSSILSAVVVWDGSAWRAAASGGGGASLSTANTWTAAQRGAYETVTYASTITLDFAAKNNFRVQLGDNPTLATPINIVAGQAGSIDLYQDGTGSRTVAYGFGWQFPFGNAPSISSNIRTKTKLNYSVDVYAQSTITVTIASPGVVSWTAHGLLAGQPVRLTTTGALPTGLAVSTTYYVVPVDSDSFQLATTQTGAAINTTGSQSGTHTMTAVSITLLALGGVN